VCAGMCVSTDGSLMLLCCDFSMCFSFLIADRMFVLVFRRSKSGS
jgi:hypothetical protein